MRGPVEPVEMGLSGKQAVNGALECRGARDNAATVPRSAAATPNTSPPGSAATDLAFGVLLQELAHFRTANLAHLVGG